MRTYSHRGLVARYLCLLTFLSLALAFLPGLSQAATDRAKGKNTTSKKPATTPVKKVAKTPKKANTAKSKTKTQSSKKDGKAKSAQASRSAKNRPVPAKAATKKAAAAKTSATKPSTAKAPNTKNSVKKGAKSASVMPSRSQWASVGGGDEGALPNIKSSVALVVDQDTNEVLLSKNDDAVLPVASISKLLGAVVLVESGQSMNESITITKEDVDTYKGSRSRLSVGTVVTRGDALKLMLMSSENRAAHALARHYPGGIKAFVQHMNDAARRLGMSSAHFTEPTGLSSANQSNARDLAILVDAAHSYPLLRKFTTAPGYEINVGQRTEKYVNSNRLVRTPDWDIGLQKTGFISEAGRCLAMQVQVAGRKLIMVFLNAASSADRIADAEQVRAWVKQMPAKKKTPYASGEGQQAASL